VKDAVDSLTGVRVAFIYGSFVKGDERQDSDIDVFLIEDNINEDELVMNLNRLEKKLFKEINYTRYTESEYKKEKRCANFSDIRLLLCKYLSICFHLSP